MSINNRLQEIINQCLTSKLKTAVKLQKVLEENRENILQDDTVNIEALLNCLMTKGTGKLGSSALQ